MLSKESRGSDINIETMAPRNDDCGYKQQDVLIDMYFSKQMSIQDIADEFDVATRTITYWMDKFEIDRRDRTEAIRMKLRVPYASYGMNAHGHMIWQTSLDGEQISATVHQLLAIAKGSNPHEIYGGDTDVHHINRLEWGNWPDNIVALSSQQHRATGHLFSLNEEDRSEVMEVVEKYDHLALNKYEGGE